MADTLLEVEALEAGYGEVQVLWGVSLNAVRGHLTAIVGANGAGKTTMLRAVAGTISPWKGRVLRRRGRDPAVDPRRRRRVASRWYRRGGNCFPP